jgi:monoamine oxidase
VRLSAPAAIVALPLGVLQARPGENGAVRFEPALASDAAKRAALDGLVMGRAARLVLRFRAAWWPETLSFLHLPGARTFPIWWTRSPLAAPLLTGWVGGPASDRLDGRTTDEIVDAALTELAAASGVPRARMAESLVEARRHDWTADPFARGAYSYVAVGGDRASAALAEPLGGTLFFAGEATAAEPGEHGTVQAALASGERAARQLLDARTGA